jgi:FAD/FMN-containing dehydrogenase
MSDLVTTAPKAGSTVLNDVHARLNTTRVHQVFTPRTVDEVIAAVRHAGHDGRPVSICGGRHAMGGQQFVAGGYQLDLNRLDSVVDFRPAQRLLTVQAGMPWPHQQAAQHQLQHGVAAPLTFRQKQTGADRLSIGGALAANIHGRGLRYKPFVEDVESFTIVAADGEVRRCSRSENAELFALAIGGYGLFGVICDVTLRLVPRHKLRRSVAVIPLAGLPAAYERRLAEGYEYGDFQFAIDPADPGFLSQGVLSTYLPVSDDVPVTTDGVQLESEQWEHLLELAHTDKAQAFDRYAAHYRSTHGQVYWSDLHQLGVYVDGYHDRIDRSASEMITEVFLPLDQLLDFMADCRDDFRRHRVAVIYGTIRVIRQDDETFLPWAPDDRACVIFNLHVRHDPDGIARAQRDFRRIIDRALQRAGSFYLTYHRWATLDQLIAGHPRFPEFLRAKLAVDPDERFQSEWYRHWRDLLQASDAPGA